VCVCVNIHTHTHHKQSENYCMWFISL